MFARIASLFRELDTSEVDAAIAEARCQQHQVRVRARALRMDISCGDPAGAIDNLVGRVSSGAGHLLRRIYDQPTRETVPPQMQRLLDDMKGDTRWGDTHARSSRRS